MGRPAVAQMQDRISELEAQVTQLQQRVANQQETIESQRQQVTRLQQLGSRRVARLAPMTGIELARLSGGYDANGDATDDGIVLYVQPVDADGDVVKAAGQMTVQLFDLSAPGGPATIRREQYGPDELRRLWSGRFMTDHYTIRLPWPEGYQPPRQVTALVEFTDNLTGKTFSKQQAFEVQSTEPTRPAAGAAVASPATRPVR